MAVKRVTVAPASLRTMKMTATELHLDSGDTVFDRFARADEHWY
jgi:hypothetical protein